MRAKVGPGEYRGFNNLDGSRPPKNLFDRLTHAESATKSER